MRRLRELFSLPLVRLLAINLAIGVAVALIMLAGLLALDPGGLRRLILADTAPVTALALLGFGLVITFGSVAMGTAIMALGRSDRPGRGDKSPREAGVFKLRAAPAVKPRSRAEFSA